MDFSALRIRGGALAALIALGTIGAGTVHAAQTLTVTSGATGTISCNTLTGPGAAASVTIHIGTALVSPATLAVTVTTANGLVVTPTGGTSFTSTLQNLTYTVNAAAGCVGTSSTSGTPSSISFAVTGPLTATAAETVTVTSAIETISVTNGAAAAALTCNSASGPGTPAVITLTAGTPIVGPATVAVTAVAPTGFTATPVGATSFSAGVSTLQYSLNAASGCGATSGNFTFTPAGGSTSTVAATDTVTYVSPLVVSPSTVNLQCTYSSASGGTWTPGPAQTVSVTSAASGGTVFSIDNATVTGETAPASYLTLSSLAGGTASSTPVTFTVQAKATTTGSGATSGCGGYTTLGTHTSTIYLDNSPAPAKLVTVNMQIVSGSVLTVAPTNSLTYVKGSGTPGYVQVPVSSTPTGLFASVNTSLPVWLTMDSTSATLPHSFRFSTTSACDSLAPGTYTTTVNFSVAGYADTPMTISLLLTNKAPTLSVQTSPGLLTGSTPTVQNMNWTLGTAQPTALIIAESSDSPIGFTAAGGGTLGPVPATTSGLAYNFGTQIGVTFNSLAFAAAVPGTTLTGTVTLTWGSPASTIVVTFNVHVLSAAPTLTAIVPASIPTAPAGHQFSVTLSGTGFVIGTDPSQATRVGLIPLNGTSIVGDTAITSVNVQSTNIFLTITVPSTTDANLPFTSGGPVTIGICNPNGSNTPCTTPQAQVTLTIGAGPIIQAVTSASSFTETSSPTTAAYDMLSAFGANFCPACSSSTVVTGTLNSATESYPAALPLPDGVHFLTASFYHPGAAWIGNAPILFATNSQINLLVPGSLPSSGAVDLVIGYATSAALPTSGTEPAASSSYSIYPLTAAATDPGVFTVGADGQGQGAILNAQTYALITSTNPAGMRSTGTSSDTVALYVTGLGAPDSTATNTTGGSDAAPADCVSSGAYEGAFTPPLTNMDGAVIQYSLLDPSRLPPCMASGGTIPTVTVGGVAVTSVGYSGFVDSAVAGLYQVNITLPSTTGSFTSMTGTTITNIAAPVELPVVITSNGVASQQGVGIWVAPRLLVTAPTALTGTVGVPWASSNNVVTATQGTGTYLYALSPGSTLPAGLTLSSAGAISGTPAANTGGSYIVTVTATDSAAVPVTGSVTFTIVVAADLFMTSSGTAPYTPGAASGAPYSNVTKVTATGGKVAYAYTIVVTPPTGGAASDITVNSTTGYVSVAGTAITGSYSVTVTATDSTTGTPLTGSITFTITLS